MQHAKTHRLIASLVFVWSSKTSCNRLPITKWTSWISVFTKNEKSEKKLLNCCLRWVWNHRCFSVHRLATQVLNSALKTAAGAKRLYIR